VTTLIYPVVSIDELEKGHLYFEGPRDARTPWAIEAKRSLTSAKGMITWMLSQKWRA
jgi:hypothetical protein